MFHEMSLCWVLSQIFSSSTGAVGLGRKTPE